MQGQTSIAHFQHRVSLLLLLWSILTLVAGFCPVTPPVPRKNLIALLGDGCVTKQQQQQHRRRHIKWKNRRSTISFTRCYMTGSPTTTTTKDNDDDDEPKIPTPATSVPEPEYNFFAEVRSFFGSIFPNNNNKYGVVETNKSTNVKNTAIDTKNATTTTVRDDDAIKNAILEDDPTKNKESSSVNETVGKSSIELPVPDTVTSTVGEIISSTNAVLSESVARVDTTTSTMADDSPPPTLEKSKEEPVTTTTMDNGENVEISEQISNEERMDVVDLVPVRLQEEKISTPNEVLQPPPNLDRLVENVVETDNGKGPETPPPPPTANKSRYDINQVVEMARRAVEEYETKQAESQAVRMETQSPFDNPPNKPAFGMDSVPTLSIVSPTKPETDSQKNVVVAIETAATANGGKDAVASSINDESELEPHLAANVNSTFVSTISPTTIDPTLVVGTVNKATASTKKINTIQDSIKQTSYPAEDEDDEISDEDFMDMVELAQSFVPEGKIAGLDQVLMMSPSTAVQADQRDPAVKDKAEETPVKQRKYDMDQLAEMARRAVEDYERKQAEDELETERISDTVPNTVKSNNSASIVESEKEYMPAPAFALESTPETTASYKTAADEEPAMETALKNATSDETVVNNNNNNLTNAKISVESLVETSIDLQDQALPVPPAIPATASVDDQTGSEVEISITNEQTFHEADIEEPTIKQPLVTADTSKDLSNDVSNDIVDLAEASGPDAKNVGQNDGLNEAMESSLKKAKVAIQSQKKPKSSVGKKAKIPQQTEVKYEQSKGEPVNVDETKTDPKTVKAPVQAKKPAFFQKSVKNTKRPSLVKNTTETSSTSKPAFVTKPNLPTTAASSEDINTVDWSNLTLLQLKSELDSRQLKKTGRKTELIARLVLYESSKKKADDEGADSSAKVEGAGPSNLKDISSTNVKTIDWQAMSVTQLRTELKQRNLQVSGKKDDLIARLESFKTEEVVPSLSETTKDVPSAINSIESDTEPSAETMSDYVFSGPLSQQEPILTSESPEEVFEPLLEKNTTESQSIHTDGSDYANMTVTELRAVLKSRGLSIAGKKSVLLDRISQSEFIRGDYSKGEPKNSNSESGVTRVDYKINKGESEKNNDSGEVVSRYETFDNPRPGGNNANSPITSMVEDDQFPVFSDDVSMRQALYPDLAMEALGPTKRSNVLELEKPPIKTSRFGSPVGKYGFSTKVDGDDFVVDRVLLDDLTQQVSEYRTSSSPENGTDEMVSQSSAVDLGVNTAISKEFVEVIDFEMNDFGTKQLLGEADKARQSVLFDNNLSIVNEKWTDKEFEVGLGSTFKIDSAIRQTVSDTSVPSLNISDLPRFKAGMPSKEDTFDVDINEFALDDDLLIDMADAVRQTVGDMTKSDSKRFKRNNAIGLGAEDEDVDVDAKDDLLDDTANAARPADTDFIRMDKEKYFLMEDDGIVTISTEAASDNAKEDDSWKAESRDKINTNWMEKDEFDMEYLEIDDFALDEDLLAGMADAARQSVSDGSDFEKSQMDVSGDDDDFDMDDFALDEDLLTDMADAARQTVEDMTKRDSKGRKMGGVPTKLEDIDDYTLLDADLLTSITANAARQTMDDKRSKKGVKRTQQDNDDESLVPLDDLIFSDVAADVEESFGIRDWTKVPLEELKSELMDRGLRADGSRMSLIAALEISDLDRLDDDFVSPQRINQKNDNDASSSLFLDDDDEFRRATREAALLFDNEDEPSDEALRAIENELESQLLYDAVTIPPPLLSSGKVTMDYESMAVSQLKNELRNRGLRVTGKKVNLIARLKESD